MWLFLSGVLITDLGQRCEKFERNVQSPQTALKKRHLLYVLAYGQHAKRFAEYCCRVMSLIIATASGTLATEGAMCVIYARAYESLYLCIVFKVSSVT